MPNPFDQFDTRPSGNAFDQFDQRPTTSRNGPSRNPALEKGGPRRLSDNDPVSKLRVASGGMLEGIPVVGPMIRGGVERAAAGTLAALSPDKEYAEVLKMIQEGTAAEKQANPKLDTGSQIAGAVAGTVPMVMAAPTAFGAGGGSLLARTGASALSGTALGGTDAAVRSGGDVEAIRDGSIAGGVGGAVAPVAGQLIGRGIKSAGSAWRGGRAAKAAGMTPQAMTKAVRAMQADGLDPATITRRLQEMGDDAMLIDVGPNFQQQGAAIVATPGEGRGIIKNAIAARDAGANSRITGALDETLGRAPIPSRIDAGLKRTQRSLGPEYEKVFAGARAVDTTDIANDLLSLRANVRGDQRSAIDKVVGLLKIDGTDHLDPHPRALHATREAIDGLMSGETNSKVRGTLSEVRKRIDNELAAKVPGIKAVDAKYANLARQREAVERGQTVLESGRGSPRPAELEDEVVRGGAAIKFRLGQGARAEIDRIVGTSANDVVALHRLLKGEGDWNRARLATLFGKDKAERIVRVLENERTFADTSNRVTKNSASAERLGGMAENGGFGAREAYMAGGTLGMLRSAGVRGAEKIGGALREEAVEADLASLARALTTKDRNQIVTGLMKANGGRPVPQSQIDDAIRAFLLGGAPAAVGAHQGR